jgi:CRP-like cAMP-binding protein
MLRLLLKGWSPVPGSRFAVSLSWILGRGFAILDPTEDRGPRTIDSGPHHQNTCSLRTNPLPDVQGLSVTNVTKSDAGDGSVTGRARARIVAELGLDRDTIDALLRVSTVRRFARGASIYPQGTHRGSVFVVLAGTVSVSVALPAGQRVLCAFYQPGAMFGFPIVEGERPRLSAADAFTEALVAIVPRREFERILAGLPAVVAIRFFNRLLERQARLSMRLVHCAALALRPRLALTLADLAATFGVRTDTGVRIDLPITHENLAEMVGASRERVSRALAALRAEQLIDCSRQNITVLDADGLRAVTEMD